MGINDRSKLTYDMVRISHDCHREMMATKIKTPIYHQLTESISPTEEVLRLKRVIDEIIHLANSERNEVETLLSLNIETMEAGQNI